MGHNHGHTAAVREPHKAARARAVETVGRFIDFLNVQDLLRHLPLKDSRADALEETRNVLGVVIAELQSHEPGSAAFDDILDSVEMELESAYTILVGLDVEISMRQLAQGCRQLEAPTRTYASYAKFVAEQFDGHADVRDRLDFLVTAALTRVEPDRTKSLIDTATASHIIREVTRGFRCAPSRQLEILTSIEGYVTRISTVKTQDQLFNTGLYLDLYGYKVSLGADFMDPDVLFAIVQMNIVLHNCLERIAAATPKGFAGIEARLVSEKQRVQDLFAPTEVDVASMTHSGLKLTQPIGAQQGNASKSASRGAKRPTETQTMMRERDMTLMQRRAVAKGGGSPVERARQFLFTPQGSAVVAVTCVALLALMLMLSRGSGVVVQELTVEEVTALSAHIAGGRSEKTKTETKIVGVLRPDWTMLDAERKMARAKEIAEHVSQQRIGSLVLYDDKGVPGVIIDGGEILLPK